MLLLISTPLTLCLNSYLILLLNHTKSKNVFHHWRPEWLSVYGKVYRLSQSPLTASTVCARCKKVNVNAQSCVYVQRVWPLRACIRQMCLTHYTCTAKIWNTHTPQANLLCGMLGSGTKPTLHFSSKKKKSHTNGFFSGCLDLKHSGHITQH